MAYRLFVDSANGVTVYPHWDFKPDARKKQSEHRTRSGRRYVYKWGEYQNWKFKIDFVNSNDASIINSWWSDNTELLFKSESESAVYSVMLENRARPMAKFVKPYTDQYRGTIQLGTY